MVSSIQSNNNTLTRGASLRDTGDYDVPHPHPYTHHYMTTSTSATPQPIGSGSGSSAGSGSIGGGGIGAFGSLMGSNYLDCLHYDRMQMPAPIPIVPPPPLMHSEDEVEPAYATGNMNN